MRRATILATLGLVATPVLTLAGGSPAGAVSDETTFRAAWDTAASVVLDADIVLTCAAGGDADRTGNGDVELNGQGHSITVEPTCNDRVLDVSNASTSNVTLRNVTIQGGHINSFGGGIRLNNTSAGNLTVINSYFTDNIACNDGGAIDLEGSSNSTLTITGTTIAGNSAPNRQAGAVWADGVATTITNSTITSNTGGNRASAILVDNGSLALNYTDVVDNPFVPGAACVLSVDGAATEPAAGDSHANGRADDVTPDAAVDGQIDAENIAFFGSVITGNSGSSNCATNPPFTSTSGGYNIASDASCALTATGDRQDVTDPGLAALAANGGPTLTRLPNAGSPLLDKIPASSPCAGVNIVVDQRGLPRPTTAGQFCDVGAVELAVAPVVIVPRFTG